VRAAESMRSFSHQGRQFASDEFRAMTLPTGDAHMLLQ
jgi:hypothetical protein